VAGFLRNISVEHAAVAGQAVVMVGKVMVMPLWVSGREVDSDTVGLRIDATVNNLGER
jgi:hypothetical protein